MERLYAVIGDPIDHSLSPLMHNAGFNHLHMDAEYFRFRVPPHELGNAVRGLKALGFEGWNITLPHKEEIIHYLDDLTPEAEQIGAVNTVKVTAAGTLIGHNTDGLGFIKSLTPVMRLIPGQFAVILGAGGAARSIAIALAREGLFVHILNRNEARAEQLAQKVMKIGGNASWGRLEAGKWLERADLIVQTTPVGLNNERYPFSLTGISPQVVVADIIFNPWETPFLREARQLGCKTVNGLGMLLYQGALAWNFWFEREAPVEVMGRALLRHFGKSEHEFPLWTDLQGEGQWGRCF